MSSGINDYLAKSTEYFNDIYGTLTEQNITNGFVQSEITDINNTIDIIDTTGNIDTSGNITLSGANSILNVSGSTIISNSNPSNNLLTIKSTESGSGSDKLTIKGSGDITTTGDINTSGDITTTGDITTSCKITATGDITTSGKVIATGDIDTSGDITASGNITLSGTNSILNVSGSTIISNSNPSNNLLTIKSTESGSGSDKLTIKGSGDITTTGDIDTSGNISADGKITVTGDIDTSGNISATGDIDTSGNITLVGTNSKLKTNNMINPFSTNPSSTGQILSSDTNGNLSWITPSAPTPTPAAGTISYIGSYTQNPAENFENSIFYYNNFGPITINGTRLIITLNTQMLATQQGSVTASVKLNGVSYTSLTNNLFYANSSQPIYVNLTIVVVITNPFVLTSIQILGTNVQANNPQYPYNTTLILTYVN